MHAHATLRIPSKFAIIHEVNELRTIRPIEALAESGTLLNRRIWLLLLPVGLDVLIWFAPRIILGAELLPLPEAEFSSVDEGPTPAEGDPFSLVRESNLLALILGAWVPTFGAAPTGDEAGAVVTLESFSQLLLALALLLPVSFLAGGAYLALIAATVQERALTWETLIPRAVRLGRRLAGLAGILLLLTLAPFGIAGLLLVAVPFLGVLLFMFALIFLLWLAFYVFFIADSLALVRQSLPKVIRLTLALIHANPWSYVRVFFLYWLIMLGTSIVWGVIVEFEVLSIGIGRVITTVGNAYVGTWVTIAMLIFVWNRLLIQWEDSETA